MAEFDFTQRSAKPRQYESIAKALDVDRLKADIKDLETQAAAPGLWDDPENAQKITSRLSAAESQLKRLNSASQRIDDVETLVELGHEEGDQDSLDEAQSEIGEIQKDLDRWTIQTCLTANMTTFRRGDHPLRCRRRRRGRLRADAAAHVPALLRA